MLAGEVATAKAHRDETQRRLWRKRFIKQDRESLNQQLQEADKDVEERERLVEEHCAAARGHLEEVLEDPDVCAVEALAHADATSRRTIEAGKRVEVARRVIEAAVWKEDMLWSIRLEWMRIIRYAVRRQHYYGHADARTLSVCSAVVHQLKEALLRVCDEDKGGFKLGRDFSRGFVGSSTYWVDYFDDERSAAGLSLRRCKGKRAMAKCYRCKDSFEPGEIIIRRVPPHCSQAMMEKCRLFHPPCLFESFLSVQDGVESNYRNRFTGLSG